MEIRVSVDVRGAIAKLKKFKAEAYDEAMRVSLGITADQAQREAVQLIRGSYNIPAARVDDAHDAAMVRGRIGIDGLIGTEERQIQGVETQQFRLGATFGGEFQGGPTNEPQQSQLRVTEKAAIQNSPVAYGLGWFGLESLYKVFAGFYVFYYVDQLGLAVTLIAIINIIYGFWDAVDDPVVGFPLG